MEAIDALKQKVLSLAIQGKLVAQDPNDEPASVLLEKIKAEKAELVKQGKIKKDKQESYIFRGDDNKYYEKIGSETKDITDEIPFDIPENWEWCRLSNISVINGGFAFKSTKYVDTGVRIIRISDFDENGIKYKNIVRYKYTDEIKSYQLEENNILLAMTGGTVGKSYLVEKIDEPMYVNQRVATIKIQNNICVKYVNSVILSDIIQKIIKYSKNSTNDNISMDTICNFLIPLPPLSEQKRIVEEIEKIFGQIEVVKENQEELNKLKDGLKNKVLDLAIQGKLVEQDPNDEPASVLLERIKAEKAELVKQGKIKKDKQESYIYKGADNRHYEKIGSEVRDITDEIPFKIPNSWSWCRLGSIVNYGETKAVTYAECDKNQWILDLEDIEKDTSRILCKNRIKDKPFKSTKKTFIKGDVLYSKLRPYLNKVVVADEDGVCTSEILPFRIYYGIVPEYLQHCLKSHYFYEYVNQLTYGVKMPRLGTEDGKRGLIPLPPLVEQKRIVNKLEKIIQLIKTL